MESLGGDATEEETTGSDAFAQACSGLWAGLQPEDANTSPPAAAKSPAPESEPAKASAKAGPAAQKPAQPKTPVAAPAAPPIGDLAEPEAELNARRRARHVFVTEALRRSWSTQSRRASLILQLKRGLPLPRPAPRWPTKSGMTMADTFTALRSVIHLWTRVSWMRMDSQLKIGQILRRCGPPTTASQTDGRPFRPGPATGGCCKWPRGAPCHWSGWRTFRQPHRPFRPREITLLQARAGSLPRGYPSPIGCYSPSRPPTSRRPRLRHVGSGRFQAPQEQVQGPASYHAIRQGCGPTETPQADPGTWGASPTPLPGTPSQGGDVVAPRPAPAPRDCAH